MASRSSKVRLKRRVLTKYERGPRTKFAQYDENGNLYCYKCGKYKQPDEFDIGVEKDCWFRSMRDKRCKQCKHEQYLKIRAQNRGKKDLDRILLERYHGMLDRAKAHNLKCDVTLDYLKFLLADILGSNHTWGVTEVYRPRRKLFGLFKSGGNIYIEEKGTIPQPPMTPERKAFLDSMAHMDSLYKEQLPKIWNTPEYIEDQDRASLLEWNPEDFKDFFLDHIRGRNFKINNLRIKTKDV